MLDKTQVLPIGSMITVMFSCDENKETVAVIVGHLTLRKDRQCCYDYACVEYPSGIEDGVFYVNAPDIVQVVYIAEDTGQMHEKWMDRKFGEYQAYYAHFRPEMRPSIDEMRMKTKNAGATLRCLKKIRHIKRWVCAIVLLIGTVLTAILTGSWEAVTGAVLFSLVGWLAAL